MKPQLTLGLILAAAFAGSATSQNPNPPAKEVAKFDRLLGVWKGAGTHAESFGSQPMPWTCDTKITRALGGHFILEETAIHVGPGMPPMCFTSLLGWDAENGRYIALSTSNMGDTRVSEPVFSDDDTIVQIDKAYPNGVMTAERWRTYLGDDEYSFVGETAQMDGRPFVNVRGTMTRTEAADASTSANPGAFFGVTQNAHMERLCKMAGTYELEGTMILEPGAQPAPIHGTQTFRPIFGGTVLEMTTVGEPDYEGWGAFAWDERESAYRLIFANTQGESGTVLCRWDGNDLVSTRAGLLWGKTSASRTISSCNAEGHLTKSVSHHLFGTAAPIKTMEVTYKRAD